MKTTLKNIFLKMSNGVLAGIGFFITVGILGVVYATYTTITPVTTGQTLTSTLFNNVIANIEDLNTRVTALSGGGGGVPSGAVIYVAGESCPTGYLFASGGTVSRTTYSTLFTAISTIYGVGDGSTTFKLPDLRGYFVRGRDNAAGNDPDRASRTNRGDGVTGDRVGTKQAEAFKAHAHTESLGPQGGESYVGYSVNAYYAQSLWSTASTGGNETRPKNINLLPCIKN